METIPVIDLLQGKVVRAQRGERDRYLPIQSRLCASTQPIEVAHALMELYPFKKLYIADLDAIQGFGDHRTVIRTLLREFPHLQLWVDCGVRVPQNWYFSNEPNVRCVLGSEALPTLTHYEALVKEFSANHPILSLDFNHSGFIGPDGLLEHERWPSTIICMTLAKVGSYDGPDFMKLGELNALNPGSRLYAAGGIRGLEDLMALKSTGIAGALIASCLHDGRLTSADLLQLRT